MHILSDRSGVNQLAFCKAYIVEDPTTDEFVTDHTDLSDALVIVALSDCPLSIRRRGTGQRIVLTPETASDLFNTDNYDNLDNWSTVVSWVE